MARMQRKFADSRAAANEAAARRRGDYNQFERRILNKGIDDDQKRGFRASIDETPILSEGVRTVENIAKKYLPGLLGLGQRMTTGAASAWDEAQEARRDDKKWTLGGDPLDITRGSDAYRYLLTQIDDPEDRKAFRREVGKNNLHWTELNEYAGENAAGLAKKINEYNAGIRSFPKGEDAYEDLIGQGKALRDTGMIGDAAARIAEAQDLGKAGFFEPWMNEEFESVTPPFDDTVTQVFPASTDPDEIFYPPRPDVLSRQEGLDTSPEIQEFMMNLYTDPEVGDPRYRVEPSPPPLIEDIADSASLAEEIAERDRRLNRYPYDDFPMVNAPVETINPDFYDFLGKIYGPTGMDIYDAEEEERRKSRGLWGPQYYPDQLGPVDI